MSTPSSSEAMGHSLPGGDSSGGTPAQGWQYNHAMRNYTKWFPSSYVSTWKLTDGSEHPFLWTLESVEPGRESWTWSWITVPGRTTPPGPAVQEPFPKLPPVQVSDWSPHLLLPVATANASSPKAPSGVVPKATLAGPSSEHDSTFPPEPPLKKACTAAQDASAKS